MKALIGLIAMTSAASAQEFPPRPAELPSVTLDCYRSHSTVMQYPREIVRGAIIDGDNFDKPTVRYRIQVVSKTLLKIIAYPDDATRRTERGKSVYEMNRAFLAKHQIAGWREETTLGPEVFTIDFDNLVLSRMHAPTQSVLNGPNALVSSIGIEVNVCRKGKPQP